MESKKTKRCNICSILLTEENLAKRTQRCKPCHQAIEQIRHKKYYDNNTEQLNKKCKLYRENNVEKIKEQLKQYREKNVEKIKKHQKEQYLCGCGEIICNSSTTQHQKSKRHTIHSELMTWSKPKGDYKQKESEFIDVCEARRKKIELDKIIKKKIIVFTKLNI